MLLMQPVPQIPVAVNATHAALQKQNQPKSSIPLLFTANSPLPISLPFSLPNALVCYRPTFTRRTGGHFQGTFSAINFPDPPPRSQSYQPYPMPFLLLSLSLSRSCCSLKMSIVTQTTCDTVIANGPCVFGITLTCSVLRRQHPTTIS